VYPHQTERLTEACERERLDAVIATSAANVFYMTDFESLGHDVRIERVAVWAPGGEAVVTPAGDVPRVLSALGVTGGRIGVDESNLTKPAWERLVGQLGGFTVAPGAAALLAARRVKSPYEIECLGRSLGITEEALNAVLQMLEPGVTEREAASVYQGEVLKRDATPASPSIAFGERTWIPFAPPTERALKRGDLVTFDVGAVFKGYCSSVARTAVMGEPIKRQASVFEAVQGGVEAGIDAVRPGATAGAIHEAVVSHVRGAGLGGFQRGQVGHAIGLDPDEGPTLEAGATDRLEAGEVLGIDVPHLEVGWGGVALRDTVLVTTTGSRVLNRSVHGLIVLD
jgi:Xaa-Pro aminopeptidase